jgi:hypothetical protein
MTNYFDLIEILDDDFDDDDLIDNILLGFASSPAFDDDHGTSCFNFWMERN